MFFVTSTWSDRKIKMLKRSGSGYFNVIFSVIPFTYPMLSEYLKKLEEQTVLLCEYVSNFKKFFSQSRIILNVSN